MCDNGIFAITFVPRYINVFVLLKLLLQKEKCVQRANLSHDNLINPIFFVDENFLSRAMKYPTNGKLSTPLKRCLVFPRIYHKIVY